MGRSYLTKCSSLESRKNLLLNHRDRLRTRTRHYLMRHRLYKVLMSYKLTWCPLTTVRLQAWSSASPRSLLVVVSLLSLDSTSDSKKTQSVIWGGVKQLVKTGFTFFSVTIFLDRVLLASIVCIYNAEARRRRFQVEVILLVL